MGVGFFSAGVEGRRENVRGENVPGTSEVGTPGSFMPMVTMALTLFHVPQVPLLYSTK